MAERNHRRDDSPIWEPTVMLVGDVPGHVDEAIADRRARWATALEPVDTTIRTPFDTSGFHGPVME